MKTLFLAAIALLATAASAQTIQINGAGATFPYPIYSKWFDEYHKVHPNVEINYQSIGSGGGIKQIKAKTVTFGASDAPLPGKELDEAGLAQFPMVMGGIVPVVNLDGVNPGELVLDGPTLAKIFLGDIKTWDDPAIKKLNPNVKLPSQAIAIVHRSDGSGTTFIFTNYLSKVSADWKSKVGNNTSVEWPVGIGAKGNEGVANNIGQAQGSIGYVELIYAIQNRISYGSVQNMDGEFVRASTETVSNAAASAAKNMPKDFRVSITNAPGHDVYPISSFTWLLLQESPKDVARSRIMVDFTRWALSGGQGLAPQLGYAPIPKEVVALEMEALKRVKQ